MFTCTLIQNINVMLYVNPVKDPKTAFTYINPVKTPKSHSHIINNIPALFPIDIKSSLTLNL